MCWSPRPDLSLRGVTSVTTGDSKDRLDCLSLGCERPRRVFKSKSNLSVSSGRQLWLSRDRSLISGLESPRWFFSGEHSALAGAQSSQFQENVGLRSHTWTDMF